MKTVAVIGANSYIARNMIKINSSKEYSDMLLFDRAPEHIDGYINYNQLDIENVTELKKAIANVDLIYFFVGKTGTLQGFNEPELFLDVNEKKLFYLLNACRELQTEAKIIFPSTRLVYQGADYPLIEESRNDFLTPYAIQKYACEQYLKMYNRLFNINYCILRICVPYGTLVNPVSSYGTLDFFSKQAKEERKIYVYGDGSQRRTFTHIADLGNILWQTGLKKECVNDVYNVGGQCFSIKEVAESISKKLGASVDYISWPDNAKKLESGDTVFDSSKLDKLLSYKYIMNFEKWLDNEVI